ncbi:MAG: hypothetical protein JWM59_4567 [Verrucomicrobiales bacterium]|nr:hypothetical protein [Verrucomicrobiales bacterium]
MAWHGSEFCFFPVRESWWRSPAWWRSHQGRGYATQAARALTDYALGHPDLRTVRAYTLPERNASTRILTKCGFQNTGEVIDPDDGPGWRWERVREAD